MYTKWWNGIRFSQPQSPGVFHDNTGNLSGEKVNLLSASEFNNENSQ